MYYHWLRANIRQLTDNQPERALARQIEQAPNWYGVVQRRLKNSIMPFGMNEENDGSWLSYEIASRAQTFFEMFSSALPSEPYIYSSNAGDLVAEFSLKDKGSLTAVISNDIVTLFADVGGDTPIHQKIDAWIENTDKVQDDLKIITTASAQHHGNMARRR